MSAHISHPITITALQMPRASTSLSSGRGVRHAPPSSKPSRCLALMRSSESFGETSRDGVGNIGIAGLRPPDVCTVALPRLFLGHTTGRCSIPIAAASFGWFTAHQTRPLCMLSVTRKGIGFGMTEQWPNKSLEPTAVPLLSLARLPFRATGSSGCGSALIR
jgi:hypothetical protein